MSDEIKYGDVDLLGPDEFNNGVIIQIVPSPHTDAIHVVVPYKLWGREGIPEGVAKALAESFKTPEDTGDE